MESVSDVLLRAFFGDFIQESGRMLELPAVCVATAASYFMRFYTSLRMEDYNPFIVARACLLLAGKAEEQNRKIRDVINVTFVVQFPAFEPLRVGENADAWNAYMLEGETVLLRVLGFDLGGLHPHHYVLHFVRELNGSDELAAAAWGICNDSGRTTLCLRFPPSTVAAGCLYLAADVLSVSVRADGEWWRRFGASKTDVEEVCQRLLDLYEWTSEVGGDGVFTSSASPPPIPLGQAAAATTTAAAAVLGTSGTRSACNSPAFGPLEAPTLVRRASNSVTSSQLQRHKRAVSLKVEAWRTGNQPDPDAIAEILGSEADSGGAAPDELPGLCLGKNGSSVS